MALPLSAASNYPGGFNNVTIRGIPVTQSHPGQVFWVGNGGGAPATYAATTNILPRQVASSDGNPGTFNAPFATLMFALSQVQPGRGDIIFVKPGHQETYSTATASNISKSGVAIIGLGSGSSRPTFTMSLAAATNTIGGDNISIVNCIFQGGAANVTACFTMTYASMTGSIAGNVLTISAATTGTLYEGGGIYGTGIIGNTYIVDQLTGTAGGVGTYLLNNSQTFASGTVASYSRNFTLERCEVIDQTAILNFLTVVQGGIGALANSGLYVGNCKISLLGAATVNNLYLFGAGGTAEGMSFVDNYYAAVTTNAGAVVVLGSLAYTNFRMIGNIFNLVNATGTSTGVLITCASTIQGVMKDNTTKSLVTTQVPATTSTGLNFTNNMFQTTADKSGFILPAIS